MAIFELDKFNAEQERAAADASRLPFSKFREVLHQEFRDWPVKYSPQISGLGSDKADEINTFSYAHGEHRKARICPEPLSFLKQFDHIATDRNASIQKFREMISHFPVLDLDAEKSKIPFELDGSWFNSTAKFINLRPGYENEVEGSVAPVVMGDLAVHAVAVGRTGSGKSVFLNSLIFNLLNEYAPWELQLYLADFKKVELSRYLNEPEAHAPQVRTVAATSEIRYVVSLLEHLVDCMKARQAFFMRLGEQKLADFRDRYGVVLPRVLFIVDEFQQLFLEATNREAMRINDLLIAIIKLGRATGFHLLFASQEMTGALSGKALANFKIRFALPCESEVSSAILGNSEASHLVPGQVYVNTENGSSESNRLFRVPFITADKEITTVEQHPFYGFLHTLSEAINNSDLKLPEAKLYDEDYTDELSSLESVLEKVRPERERVIGTQYLDVLTLGNGVVYSTRRYDLETFFLERGLSKNIQVLSPRVKDNAYCFKLLAVNFKYSPVEYNHRVFSFDRLVREMYDPRIDLGDSLKEYYESSSLESILRTFQLRKTVMMAATRSNTASEFAQIYFDAYAALLNNTERNREQIKINEKQCAELAKYWVEVLVGYQDADLDSFVKMVEVGIIENRHSFIDSLKCYMNIKAGKQAFTNMIVWLVGIDSLDSLPKLLPEAMKHGSNLGMLFITFASSVSDITTRLLAVSDYVFVGGNVERFYDRCGLPYTRKNEDSIVIDFKIRSLNTIRSFKMYRDMGLDETPAPSLNFDALL